MEDALRGSNALLSRSRHPVLILVLMEDALRVQINYDLERSSSVLILVLMEDALRAYYRWRTKGGEILCLNPCSNGRCSQSGKRVRNVDQDPVLILVLMEDALRDTHAGKKLQVKVCLNPCSNGRCSQSRTPKK